MAINATAVWRVRPSGSNTNGGGYDAGISGAATDYSQQNSAQASGTAGTAAGTTAFSDVVAAAFTSAMVGNALYITGTGLTTGFYFCTAFTDSSHITIDRSPGTGTTGTWHLGGGWADFSTNTAANIVPGNIVYILGSGIPNPASYTYDYTYAGYLTPVSGNGTAGLITFAGDPQTPNFSTGGVPCIQAGGLQIYTFSFFVIKNLWFVPNSTLSNNNYGIMGSITSGPVYLINLVLDQFGYDIGLTGVSATQNTVGVFNIEVFSSVAKRSTNANAGLVASGGCSLSGLNVHDCIGAGVKLLQTDNQSTINLQGSIIAKNGGVGVLSNVTQADGSITICNNTIDGNTGNGIELVTQASVAGIVYNNIISNHTGAGTYGLTADAGSTGANNLVRGVIDYNSFYNNTTNYNAISAGPHDTALVSNPYVGQSTENYTLS